MKSIPRSLRPRVHAVTDTVYRSFLGASQHLLRLNLKCLSLGHTKTALSANRHRHIRLTHTIHGHAANILCILSRPSVKLRPTGISKLLNIVHSLITSNGSIMIISRSAQILTRASCLVRVKPDTNTGNNRIVTRKAIPRIVSAHRSHVTPFLTRNNGIRSHIHSGVSTRRVFSTKQVRVRASHLRAINPLSMSVPHKQLATMAKMSNSNGAAVMLRVLVPTLRSQVSESPRPARIQLLRTSNISGTRLVSTAPVNTGVHSAITACYNIRSSLQHTFTGASTTQAVNLGTKTFSCGANGLHYTAYSNAKSVPLSIRFLPSISVRYPTYRNSQCSSTVTRLGLPYVSKITCSVPRLVAVAISSTVPILQSIGPVRAGLTALRRLNLNCLTLNRPAPTLSNNRTRHLGLTDRVKQGRRSTMFIFSRPAVNLRPLSIHILLRIFSRLMTGNTAIIIVRRSLSIVTGTSCIISVKPNNNRTNKHMMYRKTPSQVTSYPRDIAKQCLRSSRY